MTISLDGFVADQNGNAGRLYPNLAPAIAIKIPVSDCGQLRLNQRNRACELQVDHHLNAPVELEEHRRAFR
jgi:hypothetical protein